VSFQNVGQKYSHSLKNIQLDKLRANMMMVPKFNKHSKVKLSPHRPWRPLGLREVEAPTLSDIRLIDGGKVVSPMHRPLFTPRKIPGTHFC
jgi:hypothetical protein